MLLLRGLGATIVAVLLAGPVSEGDTMARLLLVVELLVLATSGADMVLFLFLLL